MQPAESGGSYPAKTLVPQTIPDIKGNGKRKVVTRH